MKRFFNIHKQYATPGMDTRILKHSQIIHLIEKLPPAFSVAPVGQSAENRTIYGIRLGSGDTRVVLWSQMHGDESTATRALFDMFNFFAGPGELGELCVHMLSRLSLLFIPMLNPDGAERFQRENAWNIDINRDAVRFTTPEAQVLRDQIKLFAPHFSFNLHDQESYYSAGMTRHPATISFLAPPTDTQESITDNRKAAIQLINLLAKELDPFIPNCIGKWNDTYEPRAFGEWSQMQNSATILLESGGADHDRDRNFVRKLNFGILLEALRAIAFKDYESEPVEPYFHLPLNREDGIFDRVERQKEVIVNGVSFITDIGYREDELFFGDFDNCGSLE